jgi:hypothetical protein
MSASLPTAIVPFFGNRPKIFAGAVEVSSTKRLSDMCPGADAVVINQAHAALDAGTAIRDFAEIAAAELLLLLEAERAMIGRDHVEGVRTQAAPKLVVIPFFAQRRREDVLGPVEARLVVAIDVEQQVLRTGLGVGHDAARLRHAQLVQRVITAQMHDIDRRPRHLGDRQRAVHAFRLQPRRPRQRVIFGFDMALRERDLHQFVDDDAVLGVHADKRAILAGLAHGAKDGAVI